MLNGEFVRLGEPFGLVLSFKALIGKTTDDSVEIRTGGASSKNQIIGVI